MLVNKLLETRLDIRDIAKIFCADHDKMLLGELQQHYTNRCFKKSFVMEILRIVRRSSFMCKNKVLDGSMYVDIMFEARCAVYEIGEIVHNVLIVQIESNGSIIATAPHMSLTISNIDNNIYSKGDKIPIIVSDAVYTPFRHTVSLRGTVLIPTPREEVYFRVRSDDTVSSGDNALDATALLVRMQNEATGLLEQLGKQNKKMVEFFVRMLYPLKETIKPPGKVHTDAKAVVPNCIVFIPERPLDDAIFCVVEERDDVLVCMDVSVGEMQELLLREQIADLRKLMGFIDAYGAKAADMKMTWAMYSSLKK